LGWPSYFQKLQPASLRELGGETLSDGAGFGFVANSSTGGHTNARQASSNSRKAGNSFCIALTNSMDSRLVRFGFRSLMARTRLTESIF
jgi:hypothetical protein